MKSADPASRASAGRPRRTTLKDVAEKLGLSTATVSLVINGAKAAEAIPRETHDRVLAAARELDYRPNTLARSLRSNRSYTIGVLVPEVSHDYAAGIVGGVENYLQKEGYLYLVASHRFRQDLRDKYLNLLLDRQVEGFVLINTQLETPLPLPAVAVADHNTLPGVTGIVIDNERAALVALEHLAALGHRRIAFFKGHPGSGDTELRWRAIHHAAEKLGLPVLPELCVQLSGQPGEVFSAEEAYDEGHLFGRKLLARNEPFSALFAFNDIAAIGAMRAFFDAGLKVPEDVSVVGFDDIHGAAYQNPSLTTVRQPLAEMGEIAARLLLDILAGHNQKVARLMIEPQLMVRGSTGPCRSRVLAELPAVLS